MTNDIKEFKEMFDIPVEQNVVDEDSTEESRFNESYVVSDNFEEQVDSLVSDIKETDKKGFVLEKEIKQEDNEMGEKMSVDDILKSTKSGDTKSIEEINKQISEDEEQQEIQAKERFIEKNNLNDDTLDEYDGLDFIDDSPKENSSDKQQNEIVDEVEECEDISKEESKDSETSEDDNEVEIESEENETSEEDNEEEIGFIQNNQILWMLDSPSKIYDNFYKSKSELVSIGLRGGCLPFDDLTEELIQCSVDTTTTVFDNKYYVEKMAEIENKMQRVKDIQIKCNSQFFTWDRWTEILRGCLARIEYLKPAIKNEGLVHEHMRDIEYYTSQLKYLNETCKGVMKTLEAAFQSMSRKASITTPTSSGDIYSTPYKQNNDSQKREPLESKDDYDHLPVNAEVEEDLFSSGQSLKWDEL